MQNDFIIVGLAGTPIAQTTCDWLTAGLLIHLTHDRGAGAMLLFRARIRVNATQRAQVVRSLCRILGPTRAMPGCVSCHLYTDIEDDDVLVFVEEWDDEQDVIARLRADGTRVLLSAFDFASDLPEVRFESISGNPKGLEFIAACRERTSE